MKKSLAVVSILFVFQVAFLCAQEFEVPTSYDAPATVSGGQGQSHAPAGTVEEKLEVPNKKELPANVCVEGLHCGWYGGVPNVDPICCDQSCEECNPDGQGCRPKCGQVCGSMQGRQLPVTCEVERTGSRICCEEGQSCEEDESGNAICGNPCSDRHKPKLCPGNQNGNFTCCAAQDDCGQNQDGSGQCKANETCTDADGNVINVCADGMKCCGKDGACIPKDAACCVNPSGNKVAKCPSGKKCCGTVDRDVKEGEPVPEIWCIDEEKVCCTGVSEKAILTCPGEFPKCCVVGDAAECLAEKEVCCNEFKPHEVKDNDGKPRTIPHYCGEGLRCCGGDGEFSQCVPNHIDCCGYETGDGRTEKSLKACDNNAGEKCCGTSSCIPMSRICCDKGAKEDKPYSCPANACCGDALGECQDCGPIA